MLKGEIDLKLSKKKVGTMTVIAGLLVSVGFNTYLLQLIDKTEENMMTEKENISKREEALDVFVSQVMNKSAEYASHEDMILAFGYDAMQKPIQYNGDVYYFDLKDVQSHSFDEAKEVKYKINADITVLKDKVVNGNSYLRNELPIEVMEKSLNVAKGLQIDIHEEENQLPPGHENETEEEHHSHSHDGHESHVNIPYVDTIQFEKEAKKPLVVHEWKQTMAFNMKEHTMMDLTNEAYINMLREFVAGIVLDKNMDYTINIQDYESHYRIEAKSKTDSKTFVYSKESREMSLVEK